MYNEGGASGLKYFSYQMTTGQSFQESVPYRTSEECIKQNTECKVHYRDAELKFTDNDFKGVIARFGEAMDW